jgi:hypothetical protein
VRKCGAVLEVVDGSGQHPHARGVFLQHLAKSQMGTPPLLPVAGVFSYGNVVAGARYRSWQFSRADDKLPKCPPAGASMPRRLIRVTPVAHSCGRLRPSAVIGLCGIKVSYSHTHDSHVAESDKLSARSALESETQASHNGSQESQSVAHLITAVWFDLKWPPGAADGVRPQYIQPVTRSIDPLTTVQAHA